MNLTADSDFDVPVQPTQAMEQETYGQEAEDDIDYDRLNDDPLLAIMGDLTTEEKALYESIQQKLKNTDPVIQLFKELKNRPSDEEIEALKAQVGEVYFVALSETENFLFRGIRRQEWRTLTSKIQKLDEMKKTEAIVIKAVLYPKLDQLTINMLSAGVVDTMRELILQASNFMTTEYAMRLVRKL